MNPTREILFRGKRKSDGEWIEGHYIVYGNYHAILPKGACFYGVDPETVGQYTGLTDKNGKRIFEGDILSERPSMNSISFVGKVVFNEDVAAFQIVFDTGRVFVLGAYSRSYSVIGNVHDNPELLGENPDNPNQEE